MPLTFAHPAAVLPFSRKSKYIHFSALVLGSMAPDFEYFLRGQPIGAIGHTFSGFLYYNLPLVAFIYLIYHYFIHQTLINHLPAFLQDSSKNRIHTNNVLKVVIFIYSALLGMLTHVAWDSFTHKNGYMVQKFPTILANTFTIDRFEIPLYKFLQHGGTLFGLILIVGYVYFRTLSQKQKKMNIPTKQKLTFWLSLILLTLFIVFFWYVIDYVSILSYGIVVVRIIDSFFISLLIISLFYKFIQKR
ncbi:hypothetical protein CSE16_10565 [Solibacillus sp. R5-41]|uniref:DUF4184 family protein n=1 Tax=Solibacillus sp. R5-41 TaxID=2048654 RepID=UPI000C128D7D|nr:DUF4184 family protein [Solibacillus sp. R5-41]ATP40453.1 hypothetical protein CSE16_10565 [Solibacillus sp. R5-41]